MAVNCLIEVLHLPVIVAQEHVIIGMHKVRHRDGGNNHNGSAFNENSCGVLASRGCDGGPF